MRSLSFLLLSACSAIGLSASGQKVTLDRTLSGVIDSTWLPVTRHANVFEDIGWLQPDVNAKAFTFTDERASVEIAGATFTVVRNDSGLTLLNGSATYTGTARRCTNCYMHRADLKYKPVTTTMWVPRTTLVMQSQMVSHTRMVTSYQYNSATHTSQPVYSTETYYTTEFRSVPQTTHVYESRTTYVLDIPPTQVVEFKDVGVPGNTILVYVPKDPSAEYHIQPISYLIALSEEKFNYLFLDVDGNGRFTDEHDQVAFNTWDPYSARSVFRQMKRFKGNKWYSLGELQRTSFIGFELSDDQGQVRGSDLNRPYYGTRTYGSIAFVGLAEDAEATVNGKRFRYNRIDDGLKCQYGHYLVHLRRPGYLEQTSAVHLSAAAPKATVTWTEPLQARTLRIDNLFSANFFVTISTADGYSASYYNEKDLLVPAGKVHVAIDNDDFLWEKDYDMAATADLVIDYEAESKALLPEAGKDAGADPVPAQDAAPAQEDNNGQH